jgi:hypothetical protein
MMICIPMTDTWSTDLRCLSMQGVLSTLDEEMHKLADTGQSKSSSVKHRPRVNWDDHERNHLLVQGSSREDKPGHHTVGDITLDCNEIRKLPLHSSAPEKVSPRAPNARQMTRLGSVRFPTAARAMTSRAAEQCGTTYFSTGRPIAFERETLREASKGISWAMANAEEAETELHVN